MTCFFEHPNGTKETFYEITYNVPPVGVVWDFFAGEWVQTEIFSRSDEPEEQYWERPVKDFDYNTRRKKEKLKQESNEFFVDPELEAFREQEWRRRINGFWFMNNGVPTFITGLHYFYLTWWRIDIGYPNYRYADRCVLCEWSYCEGDPNSYGLVEAARRRSGKTYRSTCLMFDFPSRTIAMDNLAGIQSKTRPDAAKVFSKMINSFRSLPDFFVPIYDTSAGSRPKSSLTFLEKSSKGQDHSQIDTAIGATINFESYENLAYDGTKLIRYLRDECFGEDVELQTWTGSSIKAKDVHPGMILMGGDGTPRNVFQKSEGESDLYEIKLNKGGSFICNESHTLILKWARRDYDLFSKYKFGDVLEIKVSDFLNLNTTSQKHLMMFFGDEVDYSKSELPINPYFLGIWLGDGNQHSPTIYSEDDEVIDWISSTYEKTRIDKLKNNLRSIRVNGGMQVLLKNNNLHKNKHIPIEYQMSSVSQRMSLLAGLLDSDGHYDGSGYEITQKRENLAIQINILARSLGFYSSIKEKTASMKRSDGSYYRGKAYRVCIYGQLDKIPCKVERKKAKVSTHKNRRNPNNVGFKITPIGKGKHISITTDGDHKIRLANGVVVSNCGKTELTDVYQGWSVVKPCLTVGTRTIVGKAIYTTTIEEGGSIPFKKLWDNSNFLDKDPHTQRTRTGLYRTFVPAYKNDADFIDRYGNCDEEASKEAMLAERAALSADSRALAEYIRKNPFTIEEAFFSINDKCIFDSLLINNQLQGISHIDEKELFVRGNLRWVDGIGSAVEFVENFNGRWKVHAKFLQMAKKRAILNSWERVGDRYKPTVLNVGITGADTFDHSLKNLHDDKTASDAAFYTYWRHDPMAEELSDTFICEYIFRQPTADLMAEDLLMQCVFFGTPVIIENAKPGAMSYFERNGYKDFLIKVDGKEGIAPSIKNKQSGAEVIEDYIKNHIDKVVFSNLLMDWNLFSLEDSTKFDAAMASMWTLLIAMRIGKKFQQKPEHLIRKGNSKAADFYRRHL